jgi:hypothetical protein
MLCGLYWKGKSLQILFSESETALGGVPASVRRHHVISCENSLRLLAKSGLQSALRNVK